MKTDLIRFVDKNGDPIYGNNLVLLEIYEPKLKHTGPTLMLGRVKYGEVLFSSLGASKYLLMIDMGEGINRRQRHGKDVELATEFEEEFEQQVKDYDPYLMLAKLEW
jgi:hypothetical protein